ncbi:MAG: serine/threonine protein kinase [Archangiaceae bacterium]|nr:serine/threonine protein kinase [Archangiaceae bacterium]
MADIYLGRITAGPRADQPVAIKLISSSLAKDAQTLKLLERECEVMQLMNHPLIVKVLDGGVIGDSPYMVMDLVDGRDLGAVLKRCRFLGIALPVDFAVFIACQVLEALAYAHALKDKGGQPLGLVHSDVSPPNVLISIVGELKLTDFGVARGVADYVGIQAVGGKAHYLSPEAIRDGEVTPALDLWSTAVLLYELLANERPFDGESTDAVLAAIQRAKCRPIRALRPVVSPLLAGVLTRALDPDPSRRYPDAAAFLAALQPEFDPNVGTPLAVSAVVRGLFGTVRTSVAREAPASPPGH